MIVRSLTVGPIIRTVDGTSVRLWGRGDWPPRSGRRAQTSKYCIGIARLRSQNGRYGPPQFFQMNPNFDMTGVTIFTGLHPESEYEYQMGWFLSSRHFWDISHRTRPFDWTQANWGSVKTASVDATAPRSIVFGSCRNLLSLFGLAWYDTRGDKTFRSILRQIQDNDPVDILLMIGDQIYADDLGAIKMDETLEEFNARYRVVFSQPWIRDLMSRVPTYMTLDDHEVENDWPAHAHHKDWLVKFPAAMHAYLTYQMAGNPLFSANAQGKLEGIPTKLWYTFQDGCCDIFMMDTRTERILEPTHARNLVSPEQLQALKTWLANGSGRVKLVVSPVPLFPDHTIETLDKWSGFLTQRTELLDYIRDQNINRVVFLSGDVHCSLSAELMSPSMPAFQVISIISSPFFWPYRHPKPSWFNLSGQLACIEPRDYTLTHVSSLIATDNFTRLRVNPTGITVEIYGRKGELLQTTTHTFMAP
ncbi:MAG: alkaline phosphatase family protein [Nitrospirae bacterium]|nr:MAG: alkaline phosphatase family protein [Nitrospirota bacterium]